eukprot:XP_011413851.1 PREDICTED: death domain-containing protein CRADD [Crassostrea gigas]
MPSKINNPISAEDTQRIKKNWIFLKSELEQEAIRDNFMVEDIWDLPDFQEIDAEKTPQKRNEVFLKLLLRSGPRAYKIFIAALINHNSYHIVEKLERTEITENNQAVLDHLTSLTDNQKTHVLTEANLLKFNKVVGSDIEIFGKALQLKQADIDSTRMENSHSVATQIHKIILKWRNRNGKMATLGTFTKSLMDAEAAGASVDWDVFDQGVKEVTS